MALDEATAGFLSQMAAAGGPALHEMTPEEARGVTGMLRELSGPGPDVKSTRDETLKTADGGSFDVRVIVPEATPQGVFIYIHGGGWVIGAIDDYDHLGRKIANAMSVAVVLVDYRLAPEFRYPAAADDSWQATQWVAEHLEEIAGAQVPIIVGGDSAGGNLAAIVAQKARAAGGPEIALQVLIYPVTDADLDNKTYTDPENQLMLSRDSMIWFWDHYAPNVADRANTDASPAQEKDLAGLPTAIVLTAEHDVLRQEGEDYADALKAAGVDVTFKRFPGQMHGFFQMVNILPGHDDALAFVAEHVNTNLKNNA
jgi:acetyl esterase